MVRHNTEYHVEEQKLTVSFFFCDLHNVQSLIVTEQLFKEQNTSNYLNHSANMFFLYAVSSTKQ